MTQCHFGGFRWCHRLLFLLVYVDPMWMSRGGVNYANFGAEFKFPTVV